MNTLSVVIAVVNLAVVLILCGRPAEKLKGFLLMCQLSIQRLFLMAISGVAAEVLSVYEQCCAKWMTALSIIVLF